MAFATVCIGRFNDAISAGDEGRGQHMILRRWEALIRSADTDAFVAYLKETGSAHSLEVDGNAGFQILLRDHGYGTATVTTLSWWRDINAIIGFAGPDYERARYYPEDDRYLLSRPEFVEHALVAMGDVPRHP